MTIRITGMNSGLDTESIITELASARSVKVQNIQKQQTKLSWKIDAWKELNTKIYDFYSEVLSDMRFDYAYTKKKTTVSDSSVVTVQTAGDAMNGVQTLKVNSLAQTGYLTGAKIDANSGDKLLANLDGLDWLKDEKQSVTFKVKVGDEEKEIKLTGYNTINDVVNKFKEIGLDAKFDTSNGRFFIASKETGEAANFTIEASDEESEGDFVNLMKGLGMLTADMAEKYGVEVTDADKEAGIYATKIEGKDAEIELNGAKFTSSKNVFEINGLTMTVHKETSDPITLTTEQDTDTIYDTIKNFFVKYNELINEMDKLYNAESASSYEPLTKEEKEALSDSEVEEWEKKIKESLLRRDSTLSSVSSAMKDVFLTTFVADTNGRNEGNNKYLSYFGIETLGYFKAKENEKYAYHIDGNEDDSNVKNNEDKLRKAIANEPETVIEFFKKLSNNLYDTLTEKMERSDYSSAFTVYNDKLMDTELKSYDSKIAKEQEKLNDYIDRWYEKFSQMEVALGKLNSQESSISSLFG